MRTVTGNIGGGNLLAWIVSRLDCTRKTSIKILAIISEMGLLLENGLW